MIEFPPQLEALGLRLLTETDAPELQALIEANRDYLARWLPWAATQGSADTEKIIAETQDQLARSDGFQVCIAPDGPILGVGRLPLGRLEEPQHHDRLLARRGRPGPRSRIRADP